MATRRYKISVGETEFQIVEEAGAAVNSDTVELTVELANTAVTTASGTRSIEKNEVLLALEMLENHILKGNWPPA
ncbi:MAG TPA: hypothetical protein P5523_03735 [Bacteroidales bacterium]|nr:hypothetical protein [Bacteroidales bacterium]